MYSVVCDRCEKPFIDKFNGIGAWLDEGTAKEQAMGKVEEGKFNAYSDTEYLTKETCGEYLKSTKEHYFSKHV